MKQFKITATTAFTKLSLLKQYIHKHSEKETEVKDTLPTL